MYSKPFEGDYPITSPWGRRGDSFHDGIDWAMPIGTPLYCVDGGTVVVASKDQYGGLWVDIVADSDGAMARYVHLDTIEVKEGQKVKTGERIGTSGDTGLRTGPHLHFGRFVKRGGASQNPAILFNYWKDPSYFLTDKNQEIMYNNASQEAQKMWNGDLPYTQAQDYINKTWANIVLQKDGIINQLEAQNIQKDKWIGERDNWIGGRDQVIADLKNQLENATPENVERIKQKMLELINQL